jgi:hypothetical protein
MVIFFAMALLAIGLAVPTSPASAQTTGDGQVILQIGDQSTSVSLGDATSHVVFNCGLDTTEEVDEVRRIVNEIDSGVRQKETFCKNVYGEEVVVRNNGVLATT